MDRGQQQGGRPSDPARDPYERLRRWESLTERLIREAQERGEFDDLAGHGKRLPNTDNPYAGDLALAFSMLRNANVAPPWIEADKDARRLLAERDALLEHAVDAGSPMRGTRRRRLAALVDEYNAAVERLNTEAPTCRQHRARLRLADELAAFDSAPRRRDHRQEAT